MDEQVRQLGFAYVGQIIANDEGTLSFNLNPELTDGGPSARGIGWVYLWVKVDPVEHRFDIVYVGKAGNTLRNRFAQHTNGFVNSSTGRRHAERIRAHIAAGSQNHELHVYARKSSEAELLGEAGISMCEAEERAMITFCLRRNLRLWNYQAGSQRPRPDRDAEQAVQPQPNRFVPQVEQVAEVDVQQIAEDEGQEPGALSREDAFIASISGNPIAVATVAELLNALVDRHDVQIHYTFTDGADLRIRYLVSRGRDINVSRLWWRKKQGGVQGFGAHLFLSPQEALDAGATEAEKRADGQPTNVRSRAFFEIPGAQGALVPAVLQSIEAFKRENRQ